MRSFRRIVILQCLAGLLAIASAAESRAQDAGAPPVFKPEELEQIVAPIALYPDSLLAQVLMASTYPLEVVEAARWQKANPNVTGDALEQAMQQQTWDPSIKSLAAFPQVLQMMNEKLDWTQKLGDAFLAQQKDVMDAVQRLRAKAQEAGNLESNQQQTVTVEPPPADEQQQTTVIKIEQASPQVVYVPTYNPTVVYGSWPYPAYPPYYYYPPGYVAATSIVSFGVGLAVGSALWGNCNWGHGDVDINVNQYNNFNKTNINNKNWQHNVDHRKGVQYRDQRTQQKYGRGTSGSAASREAFRGRADQGRQQLAGGGGDQVRRDLAKNDRAAAGNRDAMQNRPDTSARRDAGTQQRQNLGQQHQKPSGSREPSAFKGMGQGSSVRQDSVRGHASRESASAWGGHGGGGGGRGGGGGGRAGGGGGRGGGGRRR